MVFNTRSDDKRLEGKGRIRGYLALHNPRQNRDTSGRHRLTRNCLSTISPSRARLGLMIAVALFCAAPNAYPQSGRNKQPTTTKTSSPSSTGATRPKRAVTSGDSQSQAPQQTATPVRLPRGTVVMDELPPAPPAPKPTPTPAAADTSVGEDIGAEDVVRITSNLVTV